MLAHHLFELITQGCDGSVEPCGEHARDGRRRKADRSQDGRGCDVRGLFEARELDALSNVEDISPVALGGDFLSQPEAALLVGEAGVLHDLFVLSQLLPQLVSTSVDAPPQEPNSESWQYAASHSQNCDRELHLCTMRCPTGDREGSGA